MAVEQAIIGVATIIVEVIELMDFKLTVVIRVVVTKAIAKIIVKD